jgi:Tfp pilus assembly protein FimV
MATISASPEVVTGGLQAWLDRSRPQPITGWVDLTDGPRPVAVQEPDVDDRVDVPWRLVAAIVAVFLVTLLFSGTLARLASSAMATGAPVAAAAPAESAAYPAWTVSSGETLWSIAAATAPQVDPRDAVSEIRSLNGLPADHVLQVGEVLQLPRR